MAAAGTASLTIAELREFASFSAGEQLFIERSLDVGLGRGDPFKRWANAAGDSSALNAQHLAYRELRALREAIPADGGFEGVETFVGPLLRITAQDLAQGQLQGFSAYRFLYERLLGAKARPYLPAAFCGAAALPQVYPSRRKQLLQSLSEAAATAPAWSEREPVFYPEAIEADAA